MTAFDSANQFWNHALFPVLASKSVLAMAAFMGTVNFLLADMLTENKSFAILLCAISTLATAYFTSRPKTIAAMAAREASRHLTAENAHGALLDRMTQIHSEQMRTKQSEIQRLTAEIAMIRISKHNALGALQAAYWYIDGEIRPLLASANLALPHLAKATIADMFGEEDQQLKGIALR